LPPSQEGALVVSSFLTFLDLPEYYDDKLLLRVAKEPSTAAGTDAFVPDRAQ